MPDRILEYSEYEGVWGKIYNNGDQICNLFLRYKSYLHVLSLIVKAVGSHEIECGRSDKIRHQRGMKANDLTQKHIERMQDWITLWLAVHKPLVETVHMHHVFSPDHHVINAGADNSEETHPHPGRRVRKVCVTISRHGHTNVHVCADGVFPVHREATVDSLLAALRVV